MTNNRKNFLTTSILAITIVVMSFVTFFFISGKKSKIDLLPTPKTIKVMLYNINHGEDIDGGYSLKEIIELIKLEKPDFVLLNDVDNTSIRTYREDQARKIAGNLGMHFTYGKNQEVEEGWNGNAILSRFPLKYAENRLFKATANPKPEAMLYAVFEAGNKTVHLMTTELSKNEKIAEQQNQEVVDKVVDIMAKFAINDPFIIGGSFNMNYNHLSIKDMNNYLGNVTLNDSPADRLTYPANSPQYQFDYIFYRKNINLIGKRVWKDNYTKNASDHLPVIAEFELK
ncbi:MAG: endonuclease/exonuclease/phosphatase family protein [Candidatus Marinimicrobia bacterium]|nr:endonuclease/exonuclease/phosphatase family protein [Candidatus Neomarinimicrobiota bacterium]